jgi:hypothetical protein
MIKVAVSFLICITSFRAVEMSVKCSNLLLANAMTPLRGVHPIVDT